MPRSKSFLPDVNVWLALAYQRHVHSHACGLWFESIDASEALFCRITQMGLLRLLTNKSVMGRDVLSSRESWQIYGRILTDGRVGYAPEPLALDEKWRSLTSHTHPAPGIWTDAYLSAFAQCANLNLVTLDRRAAALTAGAVLLV